ncbi:MAG TPA: hypothetical protein DEO84_10485 [candidate division Zixibacteria bacterium]|nr:hypothetical protein [candidate division Zixibacteria bacterium]HBZ01733.1 hypothetical protein [candidate division Zixibacteria bacterium]
MSDPVFTKEDIAKIATCLGNLEIADDRDHFRLKLVQRSDKRQLSLEIYPEVSLSDNAKGPLVVVYTGSCHLQLHNCTGYVLSQELGEVTFISECLGKISGLVVEREAACSLYSNVDRKLISDDFTSFGVEVMLSGVALSLAEDILSVRLPDKDTK